MSLEPSCTKEIFGMRFSYGWEPPGLFEKCACGAPFNVAHATTCMTGGLRTMMHNDLAEEIADRMKDAGCRDVMLEPDLLPVDGEAFELKTANKQDDARSDIRAEGFWGKKRRAFFDVMVLRRLREVTQPEALRSSTLSMKVEKVGSTRSVFLKWSGRTSRLWSSP